MTRWSNRFALVVLAAGASLVACSSGSDDPADVRPGASAAPAAAPKGGLRGTVRLAGSAVPAQPVIENTTDPEVCGRVQRADELLVDAATRGVANVIVALRDVPAERVPPARPGRLVLDNRDCQFVPRVAVLTTGSTIEAVSHDDVLHTVHLYGALERNLALPDRAATMTVTVEEPGMIAVLCDVHGWMKAYVRVDSHPFHAVTDEQGIFVIDDIPPGSYELDVWHERLGRQSLTVRVGPGAADDLRVEYTLDGR